mmetsp:Transcript_22447/g.51732  ORF Transcript_22447/g.51732 Transcript_22447/m.51732 type:complete len:268 (+) Transcript_22447:94-897(+)
MVEEELTSLLHTIQNTSPSGVTPLTPHISDMYEMIQMVLLEKQQQQPNGVGVPPENQRVVVCLATDGTPTDSMGYGGPQVQDAFTHALSYLIALPVTVIVRLCTNQDSVVQFYEDQLDTHNASLDVLDDYTSEARQIFQHNPWLTYGLALHRCREGGLMVGSLIHETWMDALDERPLTREELAFALQLFLGIDVHHVNDWKRLMDKVQEKLSNEEKTWNPIHRRLTPWIDVKQLNRVYGPKQTTSWSFRMAIMVGFLAMLWWMMDAL